MPIEHLLYIPGVLLVGVLIGYGLGAKAVRQEMARARTVAKR